MAKLEAAKKAREEDSSGLNSPQISVLKPATLAAGTLADGQVNVAFLDKHHLDYTTVERHVVTAAKGLMESLRGNENLKP